MNGSKEEPMASGKLPEHTKKNVSKGFLPSRVRTEGMAK
jgi:hypothetical protein